MRFLAAALGLLAAASPAPLALVNLQGERVEVALAPEERALVVHFWATWCPSCVEELAVLDRAVQRCAGGSVRVLAVNVGEDADTVERYASEHGLGLALLRDPRGAVFRAVSGAGLPLNLVWTAQERRVELGPRDAARWARELRGLGCDANDP